MQHILEVIAQQPQQAISYHQFMELALYHPQHGYYMKNKQKIGREGDFFTSSNVSSVFARQFAKLFRQWIADEVVPPVICELGGGTGRFARDVLEEWEQCEKGSPSPLQYIIVEASPYHRAQQQELLAAFPYVKQLTSIEELTPDFAGIIFSNELYDAFPVHVIQEQGGSLYEVYVRQQQGELQEVLYPLQNQEMIMYLQKHRQSLRKGQRLEVPLAMGKFVRQLANKLEKALVLTVDYGYTNEEWQQPWHQEGSLRGYHQHQLIRNPLAYPGEMDLTTHIHWDELRIVGEEEGMRTVLQMKQNAFLLAVGMLEQLVSHQDRNPFSEANKRNRAIRSLIMSGGMSDHFSILIQQKGLSQFSLKPYMNL